MTGLPGGAGHLLGAAGGLPAAEAHGILHHTGGLHLGDPAGQAFTVVGQTKMKKKKKTLESLFAGKG